MKVICFILIELAISLSSCSKGRTNSNDISAASATFPASQLTQNNQQSPVVNENFYDFLEKFNTDRIFQLKRIAFPVKAIVSDLAEEGIILKEETIQKQEWEHLDLTYDSTYQTRDCDQYYQEVLFKPDSAIVELRGIDNGIYANYFFKRKKGQWYLVALEETSF
jgi:hypothetical protein